VLAKHYPELQVHNDIRTLNLASQAPKGVLIDVVVISTPCVDVSSRGMGMAQLGEESCLFFTAVNKVKEYADVTGHLPHILSENVQGRRYRHSDHSEVRSFGSLLLHNYHLHVWHDNTTNSKEEDDDAVSVDGGRLPAECGIQRLGVEGSLLRGVWCPEPQGPHLSLGHCQAVWTCGLMFV
jgi:hypothetical protein